MSGALAVALACTGGAGLLGVLGAGGVRAWRSTGRVAQSGGVGPVLAPVMGAPGPAFEAAPAAAETAAVPSPESFPVDPAPADADALDFFDCPAERLRRPHAIHADGSRRCWHCGHETAGEL